MGKLSNLYCTFVFKLFFYRLTPDQILNIGGQILDALTYLHRESIVVGCLSLENILVVEKNVIFLSFILVDYYVLSSLYVHTVQYVHVDVTVVYVYVCT